MTQQTLEILYREHHSWLWQWIKSRLDCDDQARDLTQETFIKLLVQNRAEDLRAPKAYLSSIARGLLVDLFRRRSVEKAYLDALAATAGTTWYFTRTPAQHPRNPDGNRSDAGQHERTGAADLSNGAARWFVLCRNQSPPRHFRQHGAETFYPCHDPMPAVMG